MTDYVPTDWTDNVTPVNAANLDKMEAGIDTAHSELAAVDARLVTVEGKPALPPVVNGQWVKGAGGVPVWSAIAQADVTGLVSALGAKEDLANKGAVNGYAPLGADQKVPLTNLPAVGHTIKDEGVTLAARAALDFAGAGVTATDDAGGNRTLVTIPGGAGGADLSYDGDWAAGTYQDGDVVVKDGIAYLCVGGPTTVAPDPAPWGAAALAKTAYGTTLPASPVDGQEAILVDSVTNPSYQWRFRYNASSTSPYKWEFVGGASAYSEVEALVSTTSTTYVALGGSAGPSLAIPLAGDYMVEIGTRVFVAALDVFSFMSYDIGATPAVDTDALQYLGAGSYTATSGGSTTPNAMRARRKTFTAPATLTAKYRASAAVAAYFGPRWMQVTPVRVG